MPEDVDIYLQVIEECTDPYFPIFLNYLRSIAWRINGHIINEHIRIYSLMRVNSLLTIAVNSPNVLTHRHFVNRYYQYGNLNGHIYICSQYIYVQYTCSILKFRLSKFMYTAVSVAIYIPATLYAFVN